MINVRAQTHYTVKTYKYPPPPPNKTKKTHEMEHAPTKAHAFLHAR